MYSKLNKVKFVEYGLLNKFEKKNKGCLSSTNFTWSIPEYFVSYNKATLVLK